MAKLQRNFEPHVVHSQGPGWPGKPRADVIFVHGLGGHAYDTWRRAPDDNSFWPLWLAEDIAGLAVYTLACEAPPSNWLDPISRRGE